ncbi:MAG: glycosyltransferase family 2 protein [Acidobacteria bacterium]|nr:glycosyltransferase family 2 protein [Acidobacteriota bacterium]
MKKEKNPTYSLVVPIRNEGESVIPLFAKIVETMEAQDWDFEIVFVDDASTDDSPLLLEQVASLDLRVLVVQLRRHFGQSVALAAGLDYARGEIIVTLDGNFLNAPEALPLLIEKIHQGYDVVSGWRQQRAERPASAMFHWAARMFSGIPLHDFGTTFKAYRRETIRHANPYGELHRFLPALASLPEARIAEIPLADVRQTESGPREEPGQPLRSLLDVLAVRFLLRYMMRPLHFLGMLGLACSAVGLGTLGYLLYEKWDGHSLLLEHGPLLVISVVALLAGIQLFSTGLIGEILARVHLEDQQHRIYSVSRVISRSRKAGIV